MAARDSQLSQLQCDLSNFRNCLSKTNCLDLWLLYLQLNVSLCVYTVQCICFCMCTLTLYVCLSTYACDNVFVSKLSWQQHQSPHGSATGNHIKAQLHSAVGLSDTSKLNISNSNSIQTDIYIHTKVRVCKFSIYNAQDSIWEAASANLTSRIHWVVFAEKCIKNVCEWIWIQVYNWTASIEMLI